MLDETNNTLIGKKIINADVNGDGIRLELDDGSIFIYDATDGGYSSWEILSKEK